MSVSTGLANRVDPSPRTAVLAAGDLLAILTFVAVGEATHGYNPFVAVGRVAGTMAPFVIGWALVALVGGLYARGPTSLPRTALRTFGLWIVAVAIAQALRATALFHGDAALAFALVSVGIGGALLVAWRLLATRLDS